ncbi:MAG: structural protein P5 [Bacteroidales bacterium]|nr:structural protein P5 [Candidatus Physcousia equi]
MKDYKQSRGWRNNNPLNIKLSDAPWQGLCAAQTNGVFCKFIGMNFGYRAAMKTMQSYFLRFKSMGKPFTLDNIIRRWAPDGPEREERYIHVVVTKSGIGRHTVLPEPNSQEAVEPFVKIFAAMTLHECGCPISEAPIEQIRNGIYLAYRHK